MKYLCQHETCTRKCRHGKEHDHETTCDSGCVFFPFSTRPACLPVGIIVVKREILTWNQPSIQAKGESIEEVSV